MSYQKPPGSGALRLHLNENTAGCSPRVLDALRSLAPADIATYPDYAAITTRCEGWFGVPAGWVQLVNGLDEGLHVVAAAAAANGGRACLYPEPAFEMYRVCAEAVGLPVVTVPPKPDFAFPLDELVTEAGRAGVIYLTDPNNPTGLGIPAGAVETIAAAAPHAIVLVDEAYADFSGRTLIGPLLEHRHNVIVGRTFAKGHGLAALRIGALVAHPDALAPIRALLPPFSLNIAALRALEAALDDDEWLATVVAESAASREAIFTFCHANGLTFWRSEANFVLLRIGPTASEVVAALAERGILIRDRSTQPGCEGCVRITAGTLDATTRCLTALEAILASRDY
jgi:histidinol-phosphate aminotransferase